MPDFWPMDDLGRFNNNSTVWLACWVATAVVETDI